MGMRTSLLKKVIIFQRLYKHSYMKADALQHNCMLLSVLIFKLLFMYCIVSHSPVKYECVRASCDLILL